MDTFVSSSEAVIEEEVTRPIDRDRAKTAARKGKWKKNSSSQNGSSFTMCCIISTLKKLDTLFTKAQMWKQYNKHREASTVDMDVEEFVGHREALRLIKIDFNFATQNAVEVHDEDDE
jgi:hypothetical protein